MTTTTTTTTTTKEPSLRGRRLKEKGKGETRNAKREGRAPLAFLSRLKLPFPSLSNACHAGYKRAPHSRSGGMRNVRGPGFSLTFFKKLLETWARASVRKIVDMDLENKISALKDFASFGSSSKGGPSSTRSNQSPQSTNSFSPQNGWGNWFAKGEKDPFLPSLVSVYKFMGRVRAFLCHTS